MVKRAASRASTAPPKKIAKVKVEKTQEPSKDVSHATELKERQDQLIAMAVTLGVPLLDDNKKLRPIRDVLTDVKSRIHLASEVAAEKRSYGKK